MTLQEILARVLALRARTETLLEGIGTSADSRVVRARVRIALEGFDVLEENLKEAIDGYVASLEREA